MSFAGPHNPWDPPEETLERIDAGKLSLPPADDLRGKPEWVRKRAAVQSRGLSESNLRNTKRCYAAAVAEIDSAVGQILDVLERRRMAEDTVIVFAADHGEMMGDHSLFEKRTMYRDDIFLSSGAGEIGHTFICLSQDGKQSDKILDDLASDRAIIEKCTAQMEKGGAVKLKEIVKESGELTMKQVLEAQREGDSDVCEAIDAALEYMAVAMIVKPDDKKDYFDYLDNKDFRDINRAAFEATVSAHGAKLPCLILEADRLDAAHFGQLFYFFQFACYLSCRIMGVNPFNQPGVELYKIQMFDALGKRLEEAAVLIPGKQKDGSIKI